jgi:2-C-methyl-D-erythritol 2,4-cyclodiphosphate synthase
MGIDAHRFCTGRPLVLGGVDVEFSRGLEGHSDADVLTHAIMDALLGAVAGGDIGCLFPDTDPAWKDARSVDMLTEVARRVRAEGAELVHIDATLVAEEPKIRPYVQAMRECLAKALAMPVASVSIKATTVEKMGALGRREGMSALAIATVETTGTP